ncbi:MAG TPA: porin [Bacteroidetes bacterium]|nr:porin [Bacteroidota bacterium]
MKKFLLIVVMLTFVFVYVYPQKKGDITVPRTDNKYKPLTLKLSKDGSKYIRFLMWGQFWLTGNKNANGDFQVNPLLRRARFLTYAQISPRFLILMHFGVNSLSANNMDPIGNRSNAPQLFLHALWMEYAIVQKYLYIGGGLHYWNGISRITSQSTLGFMTLDNYRRAWATLGLSDQYARHLGIYAKGMAGGFAYRVSVNSPIVNSLDVSKIPSAEGYDSWDGQTLYTSRYMYDNYKDNFNNLKRAAWSYQGYFEYQIFDKESNKLPYRAGTYLGKKKVLNVGAGFFAHPNGSVTYNSALTVTQNNVSVYAVDVFYDTPLGTGGLTAYGAYYSFNYGPKYTYGQTYGTGNSILLQAGYLFPHFSDKVSLQLYTAFNTANFTAFDHPGNAVRTGLNMFLNGQHAKITLEYDATQDQYSGDTKPERKNSVILQAQIFL